MSLGDSPGFGCGGVGNEQNVCDCLGCSLESIATSVAYIAQILEERLGKACDNIDQCIDEILDKIKKKIEGPLYSCEQCQQMAANGLAGTIEYAVRCANQTCAECDTICSLGDPGTEGKCCKTCGKSPCCCKDGVCSPCGTEEQQKKPFVGWCNPITKIVIVTRQGAASPGVDFSQVAFAETEIVALQEAQAICDKVDITHPITIPNVQSIEIPYPSIHCDLDAYASERALQHIAQLGAGAATLQAGSQFVARWRALGLEGLNLGAVQDMVRGAMRIITDQPFLVSEEYIPQVAKLLGCNNSTFTASAQVLAAVGIAQQLAGVDLSEFTAPYRYAMNAACRQKWLGPNEAMGAYLANGLTPQHLDAQLGIYGLCPDAVCAFIQGSKSKPPMLPLAVMRHRKLIDATEYHRRMREIGFLEPDTRELLYNVTYQVPGISDLMRLMIRDADDPTIPDWADSDALFEQKYQQQLRKWGEDQGIPLEFAKYYWRAHWSIPSPGQLFEFYRRLRNKPEMWTEHGALADIKQALIQQDILPRWHKSFLAVSFRPMNRIDVRRAYNIAALTDDEVVEAYSQLGYSDENAKHLAEFAKRLRDEAIPTRREVKLWLDFAIKRNECVERLTKKGFPKDAVEQSLDDISVRFAKSSYGLAYSRGDLARDDFTHILDDHGVKLDKIQTIFDLLSVKRTNHPSMKDYAVGLIERDSAENQLVSDGFPRETASRFITEIDREIERNFVRQCQQGIRRRYLTGELEKEQAQNELTSRGTTGTRATKMVDWWDCELKAGEKHVSANTLCEWLARGAITAPDFTKRLVKIGFSESDAAIMLEDCLIKVSAKQLADAKRQAHQQVVEQRRIARLLAQQARQEAALLRRLESNKQKAARALVARERQLYSAVEKLTAKCKCLLADAINLAKEQTKRIKTQYALSTDQTLKVLLLAADEFVSGQSLADLPQIIDTIAQAEVDTALNGSELVGLVQTNGQQQHG